MIESSNSQYLSAVLEHSPAALVVIDLNGRVATWNPAAEALFGYSQAEAAGRNIDELIASPAWREEAARHTSQALGGELFHSISERVRKDGTLVEVEVKGVPVTVEGRHIGALAIYHDITELQRARQAAEAATRAKSEFLANMSHEIRTPMNGVIGTTNLLLETDLSAEQREYVEIIRDSGDSLLSIINDILDFSKVEAGKLTLEEQAFRLDECLSSAMDLVAAPAAERDIELLLNISPGVPSVVRGDVTRLRQVLVNLLGNAVKFTESGEIELSAAPALNTEAEAENYRLRFSVRDTGIGIDATDQETLFDSFTQVDGSNARRFEGTGLGLAICKQLAELMGGTISVESAGRGQGTTFHLDLPLRAGGELPTPRHHRPHAALRGRSALVVDDNRINRLIMVRMLEGWGMAALEYDRGQAALHAIENGVEADVALLDVQMPDMDGASLAAALRRHRSARQLPIIMISSLGQRLPLSETVEPVAYLYKPVKPPQIYDALLDAAGVEPGKATTDTAASKAFDTNMAARHPLRILLAEDNRINQKVVRLMLERLGYRLDVVGNGLEVLQALRSRDYDVVLMDIQMPEMNGREATRRLRAELPAARQPYIIALTANALGNERDVYLNEGMNDYVSKPVEVTELCAALERCLSSGPKAGGKDAAPGTGHGNGEPAIDRAVLERYFPGDGLDPAMLEELARDFLQDTEDRLGRLRESLQQGDSESVAETAHTLKGTTLTFGATALAQALKELERLAREGFPEPGDAALARIEAAFPAVRAELGAAIQATRR